MITTDQSALQLAGVTKQQGTFTLGPIDLQLETGMVHALVGENGSGKSTLFKLCMNLLQPQDGTVTFNGLNFRDHDHEIRRQIAYVPEPFGGCEHLTLTEMERMIGVWYPEWNTDDFFHMAEQFRIPVKRKFHHFSQGERKKTALVLAFTSQAPILLLDEPTNGLDINSRHYFHQLMKAYMETGERTIWMATHAVDDIQKLADYIYSLQNGQLQGPYEKDELTNNWRRYWISQDQHIPGQVPGELSRTSGPMQEILTSQADQTEQFLHEQGISIFDQQTLPLEFVLDYMIRNGRK